ncbi:MAG: META domain-containing protein [Paramuribaculum sp.]|nr:META domain-containing protein [Paramuribaculum sp.]
MKQTYIILSAAIIALASTGCSVIDKFMNKTPAPTIDKTTGEVVVAKPTQTVSAIDNIIYGEWTVSNVNGQGVTGDERPYVVFDTTGVNPFDVRIYADNGCNILNGVMAITPGGEMKKASEFLSTMKYCPDAPYEIGINMAFETVKKFNIEKIGNDYLLYMKNSSGTNVMILRKSDISFINGAWQITKLGNKEISPESEMKLVIDVPELKVHGNTGCNILNGNLLIDPDKQNSLQFKDIATTRMMCPDAETEQDFLIALEQVETVAPGADNSIAQLKDSRGQVLITLKRLNLK